MSVRENILMALNGEKPNKIPLTVYKGSGIGSFVDLLPYGERERYLRNKGLGITYRLPAHVEINCKLEVITKTFVKNGIIFNIKIWKVPTGEVKQITRKEPGYGSDYIVEKFIKEDKDYAIVENVIKNQLYIPNYGDVTRTISHIGEDGIVMIRVNKSSFQRLLIELVDLQKLSIDLHEQNPLLLSLIATLNKKDEELMDIVAESPAEVVNIPDNITGPMIGKERFMEYCVPFYNSAFKKLSRSGKILCVHMDGELSRIADEIAKTNVPVIEGFTPPPDGDLSLRDAKKRWPDKTIWINFPSSVHLSSLDEIQNCTFKLIEEAGSRSGYLFGITEDIPEKDWEKSLSAILEVLEEVGQ